MKALAIGKSAVGTRYIAEREANQEREGTNRRPLFSSERSDLTPTQANHHLTDGHGKPAKKDLRHIVISPESARAFESLGDTHEERREQFIECTRATMARFADELGVKGLRWVAGVHLNTDHPHVHILISKDAIDAETGRPRRINHIPREWLIHNEREEAEPKQGREAGSAEATAGADTAGGEGAEKEAQAAHTPIVGYQLRGRTVEGIHLYKGTQVLLERSRVKGEAERERRVEVAVNPSEIFDPRGVIEGTDRERSERDEQSMNQRLEGRTLADYREVQTRFLIEQGYKAAADWEGGEREEKNPRREIIVFDAEAVRDAAGPDAAARTEPGERAQGRGAEEARTHYGKLGEYFAEEVEGRAFPVRQIAFHIDHSEDFTRRGLLDSRQRKPTETERQIGRWVMLEANLNGHENAGSRILRMRLREEVSRLDAAAVERGEPRPLAYIPARNLEDAIARNTVSVLRDDGTLAPRYHTQARSKTDEARERIFDLQPSHGGQIYGLVTGDSNRLVVREIVTVGPNLREPVQAKEEAQEPAHQAHDGERASAESRAAETHEESNASQPGAPRFEAAAPPPAPPPPSVRAVEPGPGVGWALNIYVGDEHRQAVVEKLPSLREENGLRFSFTAAVEREEGRAVIVSVSDAQGREVGRNVKQQERDEFDDDRLIIINAGGRENAERVASVISRHFEKELVEPPRVPIAGEELDETFQPNVVGYFQIHNEDKDFTPLTRRGIPFTKDDDVKITRSRREAMAAGNLRELREQAVERSDALLRERYGAFYAGASYAPPEREERQHEAASAREERRQAAPEAESQNAYEPKALKPGKGDWIHVTPDNRCPVCKKPDNCAISVDGKKAYCRRVESPKRGRDGGFVHDLTKLDGYQVQEHKPTGPPVVQYERRPIEDRDRVYRKVLGALSLDERDREGLRARGLSDETIAREGYVSVPRRAQASEIAERLSNEGEDLRGVPGFWRAAPEEGEREGKWQLNLNYWYRGVMVPVKDPQGRVEGFQIRRAEVKPDEPRYVWLSSKSREDSPKLEGTPSGAPVHFTNVEDIKTRGEAILTEGSLKANVVSSYLDRGVVAIAGVSVFQDDFGERLRRDVPELRRVWIAYDADAAEKKEVKAALGRITGVLEKSGLEVGKLEWPGDQGKGLDDYLQHRLGPDFNREQREDRADAQAKVLLEVGWREVQADEGREQTPPPLRPGMVDEATGREVQEPELVVARWLKYETADAEAGRTSPTLRRLRGEVAELDAGAQRDGKPEAPAVVRTEELERALRAGLLVTREELAERQRVIDRVTLGRELEARLELAHAGEQFDRACEQAGTRRYEAVDASSGRRREISANDVEQRAAVRGRRATVERGGEIESVAPAERAQRRNDIRDETAARDFGEHGDTLASIQRAHADQLRALDRNLVKAQRAHDEIAPEAHAVERAYKERGEEPPTPFISEDKLDRLHNQAVQRRDADTVRRLDAIREGLAKEHGVPARDDERAGRLAGQRNVAESDLKVARHRASQFEEQKENRKFRIDGEARKWSLGEVDKEASRATRQIEYLRMSSKFWGTRGVAANIFKQQVLGRVNPLNALRLSTLNPLYPIKHHPLVKIARVGKQLYDWHQRAKAARELTEAATNKLSRLGEIRAKLEERVAERQAELQNEVARNADLSNALDEIHARTATGRTTPAEPTYNKYELRRLEANAQELRSPEMLREYEGAARSQVEREAARLADQLASGKTPEEAARDLAEERVKDAMRELEPSEAQAQTLKQLGQEVPANRFEASQQIEDLTGEEAAWKSAGREAAEAARAAGKPATPEELLKNFRESFGSRAAARELTAEARMQEAARSLERFNEAREFTQVRYLDAAGEEQTGTLRETQPRGWMDSLKRILSEPEEQIAKRAAVEKALEGEASRLSSEYEDARSFYDVAREIADVYRGELGPGEVLKPYFTPGEAAELERIGGGLKPGELQQLEQQTAELTEEQASQVKYSRAVQDALEEGRVGSDPAARSSQAARDADPLERAERELAEEPELAAGESQGVAGAGEAAAAATETEAEIEEGLSLLL